MTTHPATYGESMKTIEHLIDDCYQTAVEKGWWQDGDRNFGELIALCHSELSEAMEAYRENGLDDDWMLYEENTYGLRVGMRCGPDPDDVVKGPGKPEGIAAELADVLVRIFDLCGRYKIPLSDALELKMAYNKTRPHRHGGKKA